MCGHWFKKTKHFKKKEFNLSQKSRILVEYFYIAYERTSSPHGLNPSTNTLAELVSSTLETKTHDMQYFKE